MDRGVLAHARGANAHRSWAYRAHQTATLNVVRQALHETTYFVENAQWEAGFDGGTDHGAHATLAFNAALTVQARLGDAGLRCRAHRMLGPGRGAPRRDARGPPRSHPAWVDIGRSSLIDAVYTVAVRREQAQRLAFVAEGPSQRGADLLSQATMGGFLLAADCFLACLRTCVTMSTGLGLNGGTLNAADRIVFCHHLHRSLSVLVWDMENTTLTS